MNSPELTDDGDAIDDLAVALVVTCARFVRSSARMAADTEPTAVWRAMAILEEHGAMRVSDFAVADRCTQPSATTMLQRLERSGAVQRVSDPLDGRVSLVSLTEAGRSRLAELRAGVAAALGPRLELLSTDRRAELRGAIETIQGLLAAQPTKEEATL
ncbi:helix-turn-helix domain-containing protein [Microlunatus panaciterrae]|uniref:DNA-binding MarR family transcriptional regulator n=1 Tax=Microlunatus panaciterrae TaxID=400768 RepID=A0ABS2RL19_9ACTN|nr:DNA-binding MarR family transcriptional regulator [Microlunatus panaciterrae]